MVNDSYSNPECVHNLVAYILRDKSTGRRVRYYGGYGLNISKADEQMKLVKNYYCKADKRLMKHFLVSFDDNVTPYDAYILGWRIGAYYADKYQLVFAVHEDTDYIHIHFVFNSVSFVDGSKYCGNYNDLVSLKHYVNLVCSEYFDSKIV